MHTSFRLLPVHRKVELILVPLRRLLLETGDSVLLGVVVLCTLDIVLVLLEEPELLAMCELAALLVVAPVQRVS
jgi:hypothetical protein